ncbi:hypothetical protein AB0M57_23840 [Streptomyces sp. NPDC051597]|uniref:hypothetical protein n=1 Tax=Streptomyces sp. NPDC051597 TaxID=3155049 RepID=UPI00343EB43F
MSQMWVMALGDRDPHDLPNYVEDVHPLAARASVVVDDFADLFPIFKGWREVYGDDIATYAMSFEEGEDWQSKWAECGPPFRLDHIPGGWIQIRPDTDAAPKGRAPSALGLADGTAPAVEGA